MKRFASVPMMLVYLGVVSGLLSPFISRRSDYVEIMSFMLLMAGFVGLMCSRMFEMEDE